MADPRLAQEWWRGRGGLGLLKTGQTTQYSSELDDGFYQKGAAPSYTVLNTGQYSGTFNVDLAHYTGTDIAFVPGTPDTITSTVLNFTTLFVAADVIPVSGAVNPNNNAAHTIAAAGVAANVLTLTSSNALTTELAGASITIAKREAHTNICALANNGLMWSRDVSGKMGTLSTGVMPWTGVLYDIFQYCAMCNAGGGLAGYTDWRVPNVRELFSIMDFEVPNGKPDSVAFPSYPSGNFIHTGTTEPTGSGAVITVSSSAGTISGSTAKATARIVHLVRGTANA